MVPKRKAKRGCLIKDFRHDRKVLQGVKHITPRLKYKNEKIKTTQRKISVCHWRLSSRF